MAKPPRKKFWDEAAEEWAKPEVTSLAKRRKFKEGDRVVSTEHAPVIFRTLRGPRHGKVCKYWKNTLNVQVEWDDKLGPQTVPQDVLRKE